MGIQQTGITRLTVIWEGATVLPELEDKLREVLAEFGLEWWAQGYDFESNKRDVAFRPVAAGGADNGEAAVEDEEANGHGDRGKK